MKRAICRKVSLFSIVLGLLWYFPQVILKILVSSTQNEPHSLDSFLSANAFPVLDDEIAKHTPQYLNKGQTRSIEYYRNAQDTLLCTLAEEAQDTVTDNPGLGVRRRPRRPRGGVGSSDYDQAAFLASLCSKANPETRNLIKDLSLNTLCPPLAGKKILFVGPQTTYHLHTNLLEAFERYENRSHRCFGLGEFCNFHQICRSPRLPPDEPFFPSGGFKKYPSNRELRATHSSILKYVMSSSLYAGPDMHDARYTEALAQVDRDTDVRQKDRYWIGQARKADIIVLNRAPLPSPASTYDGSREGNWSFISERNGGGHSSVSREMILNEALNVTVERFLPEVSATLRTLSSYDPTIAQSILWHASWHIEPVCTGSFSRTTNVLDTSLDPWTLYYNTQEIVSMQNYALRMLLPHYGALFVPMSDPHSSWRWKKTDPGFPSKLVAGRRDCLRYTYGSTVEETMRISLLRGMLISM